MSKPRRMLILALGLYGLAFVATATVGSMAYFHYGDPVATCASCHEMNGMHSDWSASAHRTLHCRNCHGGSLTLDLHALQSHVRRVVQHATREVRPEQIRLTERDALAVHESCRDCHPQSFSEWGASRHTTTYGRIFLDQNHNHAERVSDDCLRCHGMFYGGEAKTLVAPLDKTGPWAMRDPAQAAQPAIPCLACHQIHTPADSGPPPHFYDRREGMHIAAAKLSVLQVHDAAGQPVKVSPDVRQRLCQRCHAPSASSAHGLGTSDDRTPVGVHAGLSCLDCHAMHSTTARASCASCHPANSHCGLDVEKMDTTFLDLTSRHNIHRVACADCHTNGVPGR